MRDRATWVSKAGKEPLTYQKAAQKKAIYDSKNALFHTKIE